MLTDLQLLQIKNAAMRVLHTPGNFTGGNLEMAVAADMQLPIEELKKDCAGIAGMLKKDETFRNVRLNLIKWYSDERLIKEVSSLAHLQLGSPFQDSVGAEGEILPDPSKSLDELLRQLKLFYARSKLILVLTGGTYVIRNQKAVEEALQPFLKRKLLLIQGGEAGRLSFDRG